MNKENAHLFLPLVQAMIEGKTLQCKVNGIWSDIVNSHFNAAPELYRIKPEPPKPLDVWIYVNDITNLPEPMGSIALEKPLNPSFRQFREVLQPE